MSNEYLMHYIGSGLYGMKRFINESKRLGVQRVMPFKMLQNISWNDTILCAEYKNITDKELIVKYNDIRLVNYNKKIPTATIFGYFKVDSISYSGLPDDVKLRLVSKLKIVDVQTPQQPEEEERSCGSYTIGGCCFVDNSIQDIVQAIKQTCIETGHNPNDFKYFVKGRFQQMPKPAIIHNKKFHRGYSRIKFNENITLKDSRQHSMFFLYDYDKRMYLRKKDKHRIDQVLKDEVIEAIT